MGRPSKSNEIKKAQGTLRPCRVVDQPVTFKALSAVPAVPDSVPEFGREYFSHCCEALFTAGVLSAAIIPCIEIACAWYHIYVLAREAIKKGGYMQKTKTGYSAISADFTALKEATGQLRKFEGENGLNLVSSQKISGPGVSENSMFD